MRITDPHEGEWRRYHADGLKLILLWLFAVLFLVLDPIAYMTHNQVLQVLAWTGWAVWVLLATWLTLVHHWVTGSWLWRDQWVEISGRALFPPAPAEVEQPLCVIADLGLRRTPLSKRADLILRPSGLIFVRQPYRSPLVTGTAKRLERESHATLQSLLEADPWNRFIPLGDLRRVISPRTLHRKLITFELADGTSLELSARDVDIRCLGLALSALLH